MLEQNINELIRQNLPEHVGKELKKELDALDELRETVVEKVGKIETLEKQLEGMMVMKSKYEELLSIEEDIHRRNLELHEKELQDTAIRGVLDRLKIAQDSRISDMKELVSLVFKNKVIMESFSKSNSHSTFYGKDGDMIPTVSNEETRSSVEMGQV